MNNLNQSLVHGLKVFAWVVGSAVIPALISYYAHDAYWLTLTPFLNALAAGFVKYSQG